MLFGDAQWTLRRLRPRKLGIVTNVSQRSQGAKIVNSGVDRLTDAVAISAGQSASPAQPAAKAFLLAFCVMGELGNS